MEFPENTQPKPKKGLLFMEAGLSEVIFVLLILVIFFGVLNFFNILSLSRLYPNQLGWLPHLSQTTQSKTSGVQPSPLINFPKLQNQASNAQMNKYINFATGFSKPTVQQIPTDYVSDSVFSGYDTRTIQVVTNEGTLDLSFDQNTLFQELPNPGTQAKNAAVPGLLPKPIKYATQENFFKNVPFGSVLQVFYSKPGLKATQVNYIESVKPIL